MNLETFEWEIKSIGPPLYKHKAIVYNDAMYLSFGEWDSIQHDVVHVYDFLKNDWYILQTSGQRPPPRSSHIAVLIGDSMWIYGGEGGNSTFFLGDLYELSLKFHFWRKVEIVFDSISGDKFIRNRKRHCACSYGDNILIFGGHSMHNRKMNDIYCFNTKLEKMTKIESIDTPPGREYAACTILGNHWYIFGGYSNYFMNDFHFCKLPEIVNLNIINSLLKQNYVDLFFEFNKHS